MMSGKETGKTGQYVPASPQYQLWLKAILVLAVITSAIMVNYISHLNRNLYSDYQLQLQARDQLDVEWGQLLLEQSTFAAHARIEQFAIRKLGMRVPDPDEIIMVQQ